MGLVIWTTTILLVVLHFKSGSTVMSLLHASALLTWQVLIGLISLGSRTVADMWVWLALVGLAGSALTIPMRRASKARSYRRDVEREAGWQSDVHNRMNDSR